MYILGKELKKKLCLLQFDFKSHFSEDVLMFNPEFVLLMYNYKNIVNNLNTNQIFFTEHSH